MRPATRRRIRSALAHAFAVPALAGLLVYAAWFTVFGERDDEGRAP